MQGDEHFAGRRSAAVTCIARVAKVARLSLLFACATCLLAGCGLDFDDFGSVRADAGSENGHRTGNAQDAGEARDAQIAFDAGHADSGPGDANRPNEDAAAAEPTDAGQDSSTVGCETDCGNPEPAACASKPCGAHATCKAASKEPGYTCACLDGYTLDGDTCKNIDECFEGTHACHPSATCQDNDGSYDCTCPLGYVGGGIDGIGCTSRIVAADQSTCVVQLDGRVLCWGDNMYGTLGDGTKTARTKPTLVVGLTDVVGLKAGTVDSMCALIRGGTVKCWGSFLGGTYTDAVTRPTEVEDLSDVVALDVGALSACAVVRDGTVQCFGNNNYGQLGDGMTSAKPRATPSPVVGLTQAVTVAVGQQHACALLKDGTARCWGDNSSGRLGDGTTDASNTPVSVAGLSGAIDLAAGEQDTCALLGNRRVKCWGAAAPNGGTVAGITDAVHVTAGRYDACAVLNDGTALHWSGVDATTAGVKLFDDVVALGSGGDSWHACALLNDGTATCVGNNYSGQLGDDSTTNRTSPVVVQGLDLW
jgi:hypothetical protein